MGKKSPLSLQEVALQKALVDVGATLTGSMITIFTNIAKQPKNPYFRIVQQTNPRPNNIMLVFIVNRNKMFYSASTELISVVYKAYNRRRKLKIPVLQLACSDGQAIQVGIAADVQKVVDALLARPDELAIFEQQRQLDDYLQSDLVTEYLNSFITRTFFELTGEHLHFEQVEEQGPGEQTGEVKLGFVRRV